MLETQRLLSQGEELLLLLPHPLGTGNTIPLCSGTIVGSAGCTQWGPMGALFLEKLLVETRTVTELCSFGRDHFPTYITQSVGLGTHLLNHWDCLATLGPRPAEFSPARGIRVPSKAGIFRMSPKEDVAWNQPALSWEEEEEVPAPSYWFAGNTSMADCLDWLSQVSVALPS